MSTIRTAASVLLAAIAITLAGGTVASADDTPWTLGGTSVPTNPAPANAR
jgi:hypothetical protein